MEYLTHQQAASYLKMGQTRLRKIRDEGKVNFHKEDKYVRYEKSDLDAYMESIKHEPSNIDDVSIIGTYRKRRVKK